PVARLVDDAHAAAANQANNLVAGHFGIGRRLNRHALGDRRERLRRRLFGYGVRKPVRHEMTRRANHFLLGFATQLEFLDVSESDSRRPKRETGRTRLSDSETSRNSKLRKQNPLTRAFICYGAHRRPPQLPQGQATLTTMHSYNPHTAIEYHRRAD